MSRSQPQARNSEPEGAGNRATIVWRREKRSVPDVENLWEFPGSDTGASRRKVDTDSAKCETWLR